MTGARIDIQDREVLVALGALRAHVGDLTPAYRSIGEALLNSHQQRFDDQVDPEGRRWHPLAEATRRRKKKNADQILVLDGYLRDTLAYQADRDGLELGTNRIYGATHHFGAPDQNIPARPFLGVSAEDRTQVLAILGRHMARAVARR